MAPKAEDLAGEDPPNFIDPYKVLEVEKDATADQIKSAYRKAALRSHPDKVAEDLKEDAHKEFQRIAFAYAVLSDPARRKRYDTTGSCSESIVDSDGFSWTDYYREQYRDAISSDAIEAFAKKYKGSDEEKDDLLLAFTHHKGSMNKIYNTIMLSNPLEDEERFRVIIDQSIKDNDVRAYPAYIKETDKAKAARMKNAKKEAEKEGKEAMAYAEELGIADELFRKKGANGQSSKDSGEDALAALIRKRQEGRGNFFDNLEAKYASQPKPKARAKGKKDNKRASEEVDEEEEPSEEAFQAAAARLKGAAGESNGRKSKKAKH